MNTNVNLEAALGVLAFMGSCAVLLLICLVAAHAFITRRGPRARLAVLAALGWVVIYLGVMLVFSFASREKALARGEEKHFCEIDCHLAYAVTDVRRTKTLGPPANQVTAHGFFYVATVRTRFDEKTISSSRGNQPLTRTAASSPFGMRGAQATTLRPKVREHSTSRRQAARL